MQEANELNRTNFEAYLMFQNKFMNHYFSFIHTHTHTYALIQHTYTKLDIEVNSKKKKWSAIFQFYF